MIAGFLRSAPGVSLAALVAWTAIDVAAVRVAGWTTTLPSLLGAAILASAASAIRKLRPVGPLGLFVLGAAYLGARLVQLGLEIVPAVVFVTLAIVHVELRSLVERFGPLYGRRMTSDAMRRIDAALGRALLRLGMAAGLAILVPIFAVDIALSGLLPATSIATAVLFAGGLVGIAAILALLPTLRSREDRSLRKERAGVERPGGDGTR